MCTHDGSCCGAWPRAVLPACSTLSLCTHDGQPQRLLTSGLAVGSTETDTCASRRSRDWHSGTYQETDAGHLQGALYLPRGGAPGVRRGASSSPAFMQGSFPALRLSSSVWPSRQTNSSRCSGSGRPWSATPRERPRRSARSYGYILTYARSRIHFHCSPINELCVCADGPDA